MAPTRAGACRLTRASHRARDSCARGHRRRHDAEGSLRGAPAHERVVPRPAHHARHAARRRV
eukprot:3673809-Prymnesium_polylepis.2